MYKDSCVPVHVCVLVCLYMWERVAEASGDSGNDELLFGKLTPSKTLWLRMLHCPGKLAHSGDEVISHVMLQPVLTTTIYQIWQPVGVLNTGQETRV